MGVEKGQEDSGTMDWAIFPEQWEILFLFVDMMSSQGTQGRVLSFLRMMSDVPALFLPVSFF